MDVLLCSSNGFPFSRNSTAYEWMIPAICDHGRDWIDSDVHGRCKDSRESRPRESGFETCRSGVLARLRRLVLGGKEVRGSPDANHLSFFSTGTKFYFGGGLTGRAHPGTPIGNLGDRQIPPDFDPVRNSHTPKSVRIFTSPLQGPIACHSYGETERSFKCYALAAPRVRTVEIRVC